MVVWWRKPHEVQWLVSLATGEGSSCLSQCAPYNVQNGWDMLHCQMKRWWLEQWPKPWVVYNLIPLGSVIIIPSGVRNVICQNKDPYQATSIVSVMVCEMHHGCGTLLNCYPGRRVGISPGLVKCPTKWSLPKAQEGGGIYSISHRPTFCCEALAFATKSWPRFSWVGVWPGDFWCSPALPATKANRRDGCCTCQSLKRRWKTCERNANFLGTAFVRVAVHCILRKLFAQPCFLQGIIPGP